jgi:hypothetical protein
MDCNQSNRRTDCEATIIRKGREALNQSEPWTRRRSRIRSPDAQAATRNGQNRAFPSWNASPFAIHWFGMSALAGHLRHLVATVAASNDLDIRDWMQPDQPAILLDRVCEVLGASSSGDNLAERLGREVWIDFMADTGDDHDVSLAVGSMLSASTRFREMRHASCREATFSCLEEYGLNELNEWAR